MGTYMYNHRKNLHVLILLLVAALSISSFISPIRADSVPTATDVSISGTPDVGQVLTGNYTYNAPTGGESWGTVGSAGFSVGVVKNPYLALDSNNVPYVVYVNGAALGKATVMKFDGAS